MKRLLSLFIFCSLLLTFVSNVKSQNEVDFQVLQKLVENIIETRALPIEFVGNSIQISAVSNANLKKHANLLKQIPSETLVEIGVYAQTSGNQTALLQLTQRRAEALKKQLIQLGVNPAILTTKGYGIAKPTDSDFPDNQVEYIIKKSSLIDNYQKQESKIIVGKGWDKLVIGATQNEVENILGKPDFAQSLNQNEFVSSFYNKGVVVIYEQPAMKVKTLRFIGDGNLYGGTSVKFQSFQGKPDKSLVWGTAVSQVINAYGNPIERQSHEDFKTKLPVINLTYVGATFIFKGDKLFQINITADNSQTTTAVSPPKISEEERNALGKKLCELAKVKDIDLEILRSLIRQGANVNYAAEGITALINAVDYERTEAAKLLLEAGADPNLAPGKYKTSPLIVAIQTRNFELVKLLVEKYNANVNHLTSNNRSPLIVAAEFNYDDQITTFLLANGANPNLIDGNNKYAIDIALARNQAAIAKALNAVTVKGSQSSSSSESYTNSSSSSTRTNNGVDSAFFQEASAEYQKLYSRLQELNEIYAREVGKIQRQIEKDRKSGVQANLFMNAERRRAQSSLDEAHRLIKNFLKKYRKALSDDLISTLEDWDERIPTYISI